MKFSTYLGYAVVGLMVILACVAFFAPDSSPLFSGKNNILLGSVFLAYAAFRLYRLQVVAKRNHNTPDNNEE